jgi:hypothetical protein
MRRGLLAGVLLAAALLAAGTVLGSLRVLAVAPAVGAGWALALELPLMLAIAWGAAGWLVGRLAVAPRLGPRLAMAGSTLVLLLAGEAALARLLSGSSPAAWLAGLAAPASWPGLAAQLAAALMPLARRRGH